MCPMTQDDVLKSKLNNDVYVSRNAFLDGLNWQDFYNIFNRAYMSKRIDFISMELHFLATTWSEEDKKNTYKMMDFFNETHECKFEPPMFYAKKR
jgi:hypothetical protein